MEHARRPRPTNQTNIPDDVLDRMEHAFHADFSNVRVSEGSAATNIGAIAFAQGADIQFAPGRYQPSTTTGQEVLGHELAHVVQQHEGRASGVQGKGLPLLVDDGHEREADELGARAAQGQQVRSVGSGLCRPARSSSGAMQAMFAMDGSLYQVLNAVAGLAPGDVVLASENTNIGYKVIRQSDRKVFVIPTAQALPANFQQLQHAPGNPDYLPMFGEPGTPYYKQGPKVSDNPAKTISKTDKQTQQKYDTFGSQFQSAQDMSKDVDFSTLSFPRNALPDQKGIDRAAITLIEEAIKDGIAFIEDSVDKLTGKVTKTLYVADVWCGEYVAYADADKDHLFNQAAIMRMLKELETRANKDEFERVRVATMLATSKAGKLVQKQDKSWAITQGTVDSQYSNTKNLGFVGKALNQRDKNDEPVFETMESSLLHKNLRQNFDGEQMIGKDGKSVGESIKHNLKQGENEKHLRRTKRVKRAHIYTTGQTFKILADRRQEEEHRGKNDVTADQHAKHADTRDRKMGIEMNLLGRVADGVESESEDQMSDLESLIPRNLQSTIDGVRNGEEVDIEELQNTVEDLKEQLSDVEDELAEAQREKQEAQDALQMEKENAAYYEQRMRTAEREVDDLKEENEDLKDEITKLKAELAKLKQPAQQ